MRRHSQLAVFSLICFDATILLQPRSGTLKLVQSVLVAVALSAIDVSAHAAFLDVWQGTRRDVAAAVTLGVPRQICLDFNDSSTGAPARVHLWREADGQPKDLGDAVGRRCLTTKGARYVVRLLALDSNVSVRVADEFALDNLPSARDKPPPTPLPGLKSKFQ